MPAESAILPEVLAERRISTAMVGKWHLCTGEMNTRGGAPPQRRPHRLGDRRLPTEPEWEDAARGGLDQAVYAWGDDPEPRGRVMANGWSGRFTWANLRPHGFERTSPVMRSPANGYGLHEVPGNVWEWTATAWPGATDGSAETRARRLWPHASALAGHARRVLKGGSHLRAVVLPALPAGGPPGTGGAEHDGSPRLPLRQRRSWGHVTSGGVAAGPLGIVGPAWFIPVGWRPTGQLTTRLGLEGVSAREWTLAEREKDTLYVVTAAYHEVDAAVRDYEGVKALYREVRTSHDFDAAVIAKEADGRVRIVRKHEEPTRHGAAVGLGCGLAVGVAAVPFPPVGIGQGDRHGRRPGRRRRAASRGGRGKGHARPAGVAAGVRSPEAVVTLSALGRLTVADCSPGTGSRGHRWRTVGVGPESADRSRAAVPQAR